LKMASTNIWMMPSFFAQKIY